VAWGEPDWLGPLGLFAEGGPAPGRPRARRRRGEDELGAFEALDLRWPELALPIAASVRAYAERPVLVFRLEATAALEGFASGRFAEGRVAWPWLRPALRRPGGVPEGARGFGHQYTEFAFPTLSDASLARFLLFPHRPPVLLPLWLSAPDGRSLLLAPLDAFHEQGIAVPRGEAEAALGLRCGWHGDLDSLPQGFASELALWAGAGPRGVLEEWAAFLRGRYATRRLSRYADAGVARLSYWTDNGAAYWYRSEPGRTLVETLSAVAEDHAQARIPVAAFELDSWFYPHELTRPVGERGERLVPPTGALRWEPREDVLPEGIEGLRARLGDPPLILHARHWSSRSPCFERWEAWRDGDRAHPRDPAFFAGMVAEAARWGAITIEQDWLVEVFLGVRGLRAAPGRARAWQEAFDRAAAEHGLTLLWCMASPADFLQTLTLERVVAIRTSGDYRYLGENPDLWVRFLYTNALARALGLHPFKDVFLSNRAGSGRDGDPHAEAEALLAALSAGPVGIGDRVGRSDRELVLRTCRSDGTLVKPDVPLAAIDRCLRRDCRFEPEILVGECWSDHPAGRWSYAACFHAWRGEAPLPLALPLRDLGAAAPRAPLVAWDWRAGSAQRLEPGASLEAQLAPADWRLYVLCPLLPGGLALVGDASRYATAGDRRLRGVRALGGAVECEVLGTPGEPVELTLWREGAGGLAAELWTPAGGAAAGQARAQGGGVFRLPLEVGRGGFTRVRVERA
jgi:hypothetical protein